MFKNDLKSLIETINRENKEIYIIGDMNINSLDYSSNNKVKSFINILFKNGFIPTINKKPKRLENSQLLRKIFELILEQCVANYYGDNTIAK